MKIIVIIVLGVFILITIYLGVSTYIASVLTVSGESPVTYDENQISERVVDVAFKASDGLPLAGWYFPGTNDKAIMFVHGAGNQNRVNEVYGTVEIAKFFIAQGYTVLLFDLRGTGESTKTRLSFGQYEQNDVRGAFEYLKTQEFKPESIGIISDSLGAIATLMASEAIREAGGIVLDSPATAVREIVSNIMEDEHSVPRFMHPGIYLMAKVFYKIDVETVRPIDRIVALKKTPLLFLHGDNDTLIPPSHSELLLERVEKGKRVLFPDTKHVETFITHPDLYKKVVGEFFEQNLK
ncbi:MAG: alpha/beta hydrolase [Candidatus Levybacteria bacterium]|nr:alpha/beta hydrolase [Candidatus Levybacteria bacterium]